MSKGSERIRERSLRRFVAALERLKNCTGTHPRHVGEKIKISIASVAREARMGRTTLHRFPELCEQIKNVPKNPDSIESKRTSAEERAQSHKAEVAELNRQIGELLQQNLILTTRIAKHEPRYNSSKVLAIGTGPRKGRSATNVADPN